MVEESRELFESMSRGDAAALDRLIELHMPRLQAFVRLRMGTPLTAKESVSDLVQSVCREILEHQGRYQYQGEVNFRQWLYTTAMRKIANRAEYYKAAKRAANREVAMDDRSNADPALAACYSQIATPSQHAMAAELQGRMEQAFTELKDEQREVILLARIIGLSRGEIAKQMERSEGSVRMLLSRALADLAAALDRSPRQEQE